VGWGSRKIQYALFEGDKHFLIPIGQSMNEKNRRNILILDPERDTAELFARALETHQHSCKCYWVRSTQDARSLLSEISFDFLLADLSLLQQDQFLLIEAVRGLASNTSIVVDGYINQREDIQAALKMGAASYFIKPIMVNALRKFIDDLAEPLPA
jgi:DNA-binding response OmpR family regulator